MGEQTALLPAVLVDRDGRIDEKAGPWKHPNRLPMFHFVADAIRQPNLAGLPVGVQASQSGAGSFDCPRTSAGGWRRGRPTTDMLGRAARQHSLELSLPFVVGDRYLT